MTNDEKKYPPGSPNDTEENADITYHLTYAGSDNQDNLSDEVRPYYDPHGAPHLQEEQALSAVSSSVASENLISVADADTKSDTADSSSKKSHRQSQKKEWKNRGIIRWVLPAVVGIMIAFAAGFLGAMLAANQMTDEIREDISSYLEESGAAVIYRTVKTDSVNSANTAVNWSSVASSVADSVVEISTETLATTYNWWFGMGEQSLVKGAGSGVILSDNGYILTCNHVVENAQSINVTLHNGKSYNAVLIGRDEEDDMAIIKIEANDLTAAVLGDSSALVVGSPVMAIGNPLGQLGGTATTGIISALDRELKIGESTYNLLQTDTAINSGNSGGGLFNSQGELIGLVNAKATAQDIGVEGIGFALPIDDLKQDVEDIIAYGYTIKVELGVSLLDLTDERTALVYGVKEPGVYIYSVKENSNAFMAGIAAGDRLVSIDGIDITSADQAIELISAKQAGDNISVVTMRNGETKTFNIVLYATNDGKNAPANRVQG